MNAIVGLMETICEGFVPTYKGHCSQLSTQDNGFVHWKDINPLFYPSTHIT